MEADYTRMLGQEAGDGDWDGDRYRKMIVLICRIWS
jgi:hypothetical protein